MLKSDIKKLNLKYLDTNSALNPFDNIIVIKWMSTYRENQKNTLKKKKLVRSSLYMPSMYIALSFTKQTSFKISTTFESYGITIITPKQIHMSVLFKHIQKIFEF
jgi:hypothetical protein